MYLDFASPRWQPWSKPSHLVEPKGSLPHRFPYVPNVVWTLLPLHHPSPCHNNCIWIHSRPFGYAATQCRPLSYNNATRYSVSKYARHSCKVRYTNNRNMYCAYHSHQDIMNSHFPLTYFRSTQILMSVSQQFLLQLMKHIHTNDMPQIDI